MKLKDFFIRIAKNWPAKIISLALALLLAQFYRSSLLEKRLLIVPLNITNHEQLVPAEQYPRRIRVELWGEGNYINSIREDDISALLDLSNLKTEGTHRIPIQVRLTGMTTVIDPIEINAEPESLLLRVEQGMTKEVPVSLSLKGIPADGYEITETWLKPSNIEIHGPASLIDKTTNLFTEPLLIEKRMNSFSGTAAITNKEPLISIAEHTQVQYTVKIRELITARSFNNITIIPENLPPQFTITSESETGSIQLQGPKSAVEKWNMQNTVLTVSCETITEPGEYVLPVTPVRTLGNAKLNITRFSPESIQITVEENSNADIKKKDNADNNDKTKKKK